MHHHVMCYYQPIRNPFINKFYRQRFSTGRNLTTVSTKEIARNFVDTRKKTAAHLLIADQSPVSLNNGMWLNFLNQDTLCIMGPEKLAKKFNYPVFYVHVNRIERGQYEVEIIELEPFAKEAKNGIITTKFTKTLEQKILETPDSWLWSHKRWKKKRI